MSTTARVTAIYVRVSSRSQTEASQLPDLERWAASRPGPVAWHRDTFTGRTMVRPGWLALERDIAAGRVGEVAVWRLDRFGRTVSGLSALFEDLVRRGVNLVSLRDGVDLSTPAGRLMANVLASMAAYETEVRGERVKAGLDAARARGVRLGRPAGTGRPIDLTPEKAALVRRLRAEGTGVSAIARLVGLSRPTVYLALSGTGSGSAATAPPAG